MSITNESPNDHTVTLSSVTAKLHAPLEKERRFVRMSSVLHQNNFRLTSISWYGPPSAMMQGIVMYRPENAMLYTYSQIGGPHPFLQLLINCPFYNGASALRKSREQQQQKHKRDGDKDDEDVELVCYSIMAHRCMTMRLPSMAHVREVCIRFGNMRSRDDPFAHVERRSIEDLEGCRIAAIRILVRAARRRRLQAKLVALFMGTHDRLGKDSPLMQLPPSLIELCVLDKLLLD